MAAPAATAVGLVGAQGVSEQRPFVPVVDFQQLADTLLGDPEVVLRDKTLYGERSMHESLLLLAVVGCSQFGAGQPHACGPQHTPLST
jgi:hypothetical protein